MSAKTRIDRLTTAALQSKTLPSLQNMTNEQLETILGGNLTNNELLAIVNGNASPELRARFDGAPA